MEASHYETLEGRAVRCRLCPHRCELELEETGICSVRANRGGALFAENHQECTIVSVAPVEAIPFLHLHPGSRFLAIGANGEPLDSPIVRASSDPAPDAPTKFVQARELIQIAGARDVRGLAFSYGEPLMWFEQILETAPKAREAGLTVAVRTRGFIEPEALSELLPLVDAWALEVFAADDATARRATGAGMEVIRQNAREMARAAHLEVVLRVVPSLLGEDGVGEVARWVASDLGGHVPLLVAPYLPREVAEAPEGAEATPVSAVHRAEDDAACELPHAYAVQVAPGDATTTCLCGAKLVIRQGSRVQSNVLPDGSCPSCRRPTPLVA